MLASGPQVNLGYGLRVPFKEVQALHERCGIYTNQQTVCAILDAIGWIPKADLSRCRILEPAAGDGSFVLEAARRLVASLVLHRIARNLASLISCITAFELHPRECQLARSRMEETLCSLGVQRRTAEKCARSWIICGDFLRADLTPLSFTHAAGNPPYIRWSRIPPRLRAAYDQCLPRDMTGGDLFLPFLDRALGLLQPGGFCGFICSDRWRFMAFADRFRRKWLPRLEIKSERNLSPVEAFVENVDSYPSILVAKTSSPRISQGLHAWVKRGQTLGDLGCTIKVGPALGHTPAYVLGPAENDVEPELLQPWIDGTEITEGKLSWTGRRVIVMFGEDGELLTLNRFPLLRARLSRFKKVLQSRSIVTNGARWFRTIDRAMASQWKRPKLLVPELAKVPRLAVDRTGCIPSHGVYAIFAPDDNVEVLYDKLRDGKLATALESIAPKVKGGYVRCYKRFLLMARFGK